MNGSTVVSSNLALSCPRSASERTNRRSVSMVADAQRRANHSHAERGNDSGDGREIQPRPYELIVVGASLGGSAALRTLLAGLPADFAVPVAIVIHRGRESEDTLSGLLQRQTGLIVEDAQDKCAIAPGHVYLAPADYHLLVGLGAFVLSTDDRVQSVRPSIDVLFESAAEAYGSEVIGVVLTGANADGAEGAARIKQRGGLVVVQNPSTAECPTMPDAAIDATAVDYILKLEEIAPFLCRACQQNVR